MRKIKLINCFQLLADMFLKGVPSPSWCLEFHCGSIFAFHITFCVIIALFEKERADVSSIEYLFCGCCSDGLTPPFWFVHCENTPMQYTAIFHGCKNLNFQMKNVTFFLFLLKT